MTLLYTTEETPELPAKMTFSNLSTLAEIRPSTVLIFKKTKNL